MLCEECKERIATVHLTQVFNDEKRESHLCEQCACNKSGLLFNANNQFSIPNFLGGMFSSIYKQEKVPEAKVQCPQCGMTITDIKRVGKLGCSQCYRVYEQEMEASLRRIHGNSRHSGKIPVRGGYKVMIKQQIESLKNQIQDAVREEKYEQAAQIRDQVIELEKKIS
ncbi:MAG: UvrB/UvrC motif-containing protein [Syntrophomonadaceae bacterium]